MMKSNSEMMFIISELLASLRGFLWLPEKDSNLRLLIQSQA
jgi:hypothetical protein